MHPTRATDLIAQLQLQPHPEGGWYRELYRSASTCQPGDGRLGTRAQRSTLTSIYFLLQAGQVSRWHAVASDEAWVWLEGAPLHLHRFDEAGRQASTVTLGPLAALAEGQQAQAVVPAGVWQAAESTGAYSLVNCLVAPGFDFADFRFMTDVSSQVALRRHGPTLARFI
jgi:predicted cupin superfamily sugar epimerase